MGQLESPKDGGADYEYFEFPPCNNIILALLVETGDDLWKLKSLSVRVYRSVGGIESSRNF